MSNHGCPPSRVFAAITIALFFMVGVSRAQAPAAAEAEHTFEYKPAAGSSPKTVFVAGEFNAWIPDSTEMKKGPDGVYRATVKLPPGVHLYKFVIDGEKWINDPKADPALERDDGHGGMNSGVKIEAAAPAPAAPAAAVAPGEYLHEFKYRPAAGEQPTSIAVAGSFNGWSKDATPMTKGADGSYSAKVKLAEGTYLYKFVIDGDTWLPDPSADRSLDEDDSHGGKNSGVIVGKDVRKAPAPEPNQVNTEFLRHNPADAQDAMTSDKGKLRVRLRAQAGDVQEVRVLQLIPPNGSQTFPLQKVSTEGGYDVFAGIVPVGDGSGKDATRAKYMFELTDGGAVVGLAADWSGRLSEQSPAKMPSFFEVTLADVETPDWAKHAVWYQIFPERFRNGEESNDPKDQDYEHLVKWTHDWWETAPGEAPGDENFYKGEGNVWKRRFGGDLQGVREKLPYLRSLGVNAIYFNPIFEAESMHKYDASDYRHIDDNFGFKGDIRELKAETENPATWQWTKSDKLFLDFIDDAHKQGFKVILDGVFNHVGKAHPFFQDVLKNGKKSKYAEWFEITNWDTNPIQYKAWDGDNGHLPVFKKDPKFGLAKGPRDHIFAITKRWLAPNGDASKGIDGWRLDVPGDIPHPFWIEWRKLVKSTKPDAYITGEIWQWAQPWLKGDQFDAVMNYPFAMAAQDFFVDVKDAIPPTAFASRLSQIAYAYPFQVSLVQQNLFDSHDTDRLASMFVNPDRPYDARNRIQDNGPDYSPAKPNDQQWKRMKQAVALQMTFLGAPMIYYGDEAGMWSPDDPSNRMPMVWQDLQPYDDPQVKFSPDVFEHYQRLIALRRRFEPLRTGFFRVSNTDDARGVLTFSRELSDERVIVVINRSPRTHAVEVATSGADSKPIVDWTDPKNVSLVPASKEADSRPMLRLKDGINSLEASNGRVKLNVPPFGVAVLAPAEAN